MAKADINARAARAARAAELKAALEKLRLVEAFANDTVGPASNDTNFIKGFHFAKAILRRLLKD